MPTPTPSQPHPHLEDGSVYSQPYPTLGDSLPHLRRLEPSSAAATAFGVISAEPHRYLDFLGESIADGFV